jgi:hypothetical protein
MTAPEPDGGEGPASDDEAHYAQERDARGEYGYGQGSPHEEIEDR